MSLNDVEHVLGELDRGGVIPGRDVAVADMMHGPLLTCPGILFENVADDFTPEWKVNVSGESDDEPEYRTTGGCSDATLVDSPEAYAPPADSRWHPFLSRSAYAGQLDYLCARQTPQGIELAVCGHAWIAEVPVDWFDDDGEPLPEHRDANGGLKLPSSWDGQTVTGIEDDIFVGELVADDERTVLLDGNCAEGLAQALIGLSWDEADAEQLQTMMQQWREGGFASPR
jgi:hypothetical protein